MQGFESCACIFYVRLEVFIKQTLLNSLQPFFFALTYPPHPKEINEHPGPYHRKAAIHFKYFSFEITVNLTFLVVLVSLRQKGIVNQLYLFYNNAHIQIPHMCIS